MGGEARATDVRPSKWYVANAQTAYKKIGIATVLRTVDMAIAYDPFAMIVIACSPGLGAGKKR